MKIKCSQSSIPLYIVLNTTRSFTFSNVLLVVFTDVWVSMGEPVEVWAERIEALAPYQVNTELMAKAKPTAVFMHCLPAYHDHKTAVGKEMGEKFGRDAMEVTDEVFTGPQSIVFQEAENRMHTIKAVMAATLGAEF